MFMRRAKRHPLRLVGNLIWPEIGVRRWARYVWLRLTRLPGSPYSVAAGFACGAAISVTPFVGFHFVLSALLAWLIGANVLAALTGTTVGNPWTFPFIWAWTHKLGSWILSADHAGAHPGAQHLASVFGGVLRDMLTLNLSGVVEIAWPVLWPMILGSVPTALLTWFVFYFPLRRLVAGYQHRRLRRRLQKNARRAGLAAMEVSNGS